MSGRTFSSRIDKLIKKTIEKEGYLTYETDIVPICANESGYLGELYEVNVKGRTKDGDNITNLFVKVNNSDSTKYMFVNNVYQTELFAYKELSEVFAQLQEVANVPVSVRYELVKSYEDSSTDAIILENIARKGFKTIHRMDVVTLEFAEKSMKELAKLHGLSFALQEQRPDYFDTKIKTMKYPLIYRDDWTEFVKSMINLTTTYIDDDTNKRIENLYHKLAQKYAQFFEDEPTRRCICHGDYRTNNIMIKLNDGVITNSFIVDYQLLHYGCPAMDIIYFIFISTDHKFRNAHLAHLKDLYHESLRSYLKYFHLDVDSIYSREVFEQDFKEKLGYGLAIGFTLLPLAMFNEDDIPDMTRDWSKLSFNVSDVYKDRQRGMIEEFIKWGYM